jgi:hypothetical protein
MKKFFLFLTLLLTVVALPSCNDDDADDNDAPLTSSLIGSWRLEENTKDFMLTQFFNFKTGSTFSYNYESTDMKLAKMRAWSVNGSWNVRKGVLQLSYDISTFRSEGFSQSEEKALLESLRNNNDVLSEMNKNGRPYGNTIEFKTIDNKTVLILTGINGYFIRVGN